MTDTTRIIPPAEKSASELTANDRAAISQLLHWQGKTLAECSKSELIKCIIHLTAQVVSQQHKLDKVEIMPDGKLMIASEDQKLEEAGRFQEGAGGRT
jgi:hypothetical protein